MLIHCRDCVKRGKDDCPMHIKGQPADEEFLKKTDDDFCSYGRKEGDQSGLKVIP